MKMKLLPLFLLFFFILLTQAQRRTTAKTSTEPSTTRSSVSRGRGRSRFVTSVEYQNVRETSSTPESVPRKTVTSRRRVVENVEQRFPSRSVSTPSPTPSKPAITFTVNSERRALAPTFGDTVEKIFTVNESPIKRTSKPAAVPQISARRTPKPLTDYVERKNFKSTKNTYEVQEVINEDFELVRRVKKPRVLIESTNNQVSVPLRSIDRKEFFRTGSVSRRNQENADSVLATKFPKRTKDTQEGVLNFPPRKLENLEPPKSTTSEAPVSEEPINNISNGNLLEEQPLDTTLVPVEFESSPDPLQAEEVKEELTNVNLVSSTSKPIEEPRSSANRRNGLRKNTNVIEQSTAAPRFRTRGRSSPAAQAEQSSRAPEFNFQSVTPTATPNRGFRRRLDTITEPRKGPSVFSAETQFPESRSRTGRKIDLPTPEKLTLEIPTRNRRRTTTPKINKESSMPTFPSRNRFRSREMPIIDEQKLEVLPLFEVEPKLVNTRVMNRADVVFQPKKSKDKDELMTRKINDIDARSRRRGGLELIQASSTEIKSTEIPARSRVAVSVSVETRTESSVRRSIPNRRSEVKESVVSEINEVTSRKKVSRKKVNSNSSNEIKIKPLPVYRGSKKSDVVVKKGSSEEVDESDNYPEAFKALIKSKKESRPVPSSLPLRASNVVTSVPSFSTTFHPSTFKEVTDSDNEIKPKALPTSTSSRWNRSRSTTTSSVKLSEPLPPKRFPSRTSPYTTSEPISEKRFPSRTTPSVSISTTPIYRGTKLRTLTPRTFSAPPKLEKSVSFKPRSSVAEKNIEIKQFNRNRNAKRAENPVLLSTKVPKYTTTAKKLDRGKYRSEYSSRGSTTTAPKYIPTIPSVPYIPTIPAITPVRTMVDTSNQKDHDDGIHVISIDEPVNALQSANLVKGDFVSSTANSVSDILPLVNDGTTEKTVSIIERIINSISARSTTPPSSGTPFSSTASTTESPSAILKLSPKKSRQTDLTDSSKTTESNDTVPFTTENPTTIIEKILSSLNAIQATDITSAGQVGIDFNTLTSFTTTPVSSVTKSSTSRPLLAPSSTTIFPLSILDELSEENKQKETVRKLLDLLNGLVSPQQQEVVVTPKYVNNRTPGRGPFVSTTFFPLSTASPELTTAPTVSSSTSTEQISSNFILSENTSPQIVSEIPNTTETTVTISTSTEVIPTVDSQSTTSLEELASTESATSNTEIVNSSVNTIIENIATNSDSPSTIGTTTENFTPSIPAGTEFGTIPIDVSSFFTTFTTPSSFQRFEVSPGSVSVFSANDLSLNTVTLEDIISTTVVNIAGRSNFDNAATTTSATTKEATKENTLEITTVGITTEPSPQTSSDSMSTSTEIVNSSNSTSSITETVNSTDPMSSSTETLSSSGPMSSSTESMSSGSMSNSTDALNSSGYMSSSTETVNNTQTNGTRSSKKLNFIQEPVQNRIDTSTPDYFIFAVLNNNTILRKRPKVEPNAPFYVIGVYPNNTVVKKFPNGTEVPMDMIIRVRGFDTRENPPPLPEITSNQVTSDLGSSPENININTDDQNTIPSVDVKSNRVAASTTQATTSSTKAQTTITQSPITTTEAKSRTTLSEISTTTPPITSTSTVTPSNTQTTIMSKAEPTTIPSTIPLETSNTSSLPFSTEQSSTTSTSTLPSTTVLNSNTVTLPQDSINASTLDLESTKLTATESSTNTLSTSDSSTAEPDLVVVESITVLSTTMGSNSVPPTFPTLSEILNDKTLEAFNEIVSNSDQVNTNISNQTDNGRVSKVGTTIPISNEIVSTESSSTIKSTMSTEQAISTTTNTVTSTTSTPEVTPLKSEETSTEDNAILSNKILDDTTLPAKPTPFSAIQKIGTTRKLTPTTITPIFISTTPSVFPTFLTTFFPNLFPDEATRKPKVSTSSPGVIRISAAPSVTQTTFTERPVTTTQAVTTTRPTTTTTTTTTTTNAPTTTTRPPTTTKIVTTTTPATTITTPSTTPKPTTTTTIPTTPQPTTTTRMTTSPTRVTLGETVTVSTTGRTDAITDFNTIEVTTTAIKLKGLSSEQKNNLREIAQLEKEQAALLQQLSFLTNLGLGQNRGPKSVANDKTKNSNANPASSLAERILALAVQRDKNSKSTSTVATTVTTSSTTKLPTSIQDQIAALETTKAPTKATPVLEEVLKQYNLNGLNVAVTSPTSTVYGKSEDAILASLLKEQGIVPSTPAVLAGVFDETTIRPRRPKATTPQPGPIMRGLNWLLNTLAPTPAPATKRPTPKPVKPNKPPVEEELLVNSPTHMTPIATAAPSKIANALSQEDIKKLINQLEDIQKNPSKGTLDLSQIKSIQNLINLDGGVVVSTNGEHGTTSRITTTQSTTPTVQTTQRQPKKMVTLPTEDPLSAISSSEDGFGFDSVESTTRTLRAPVGFNPVPGVDDGSPNPLVQSNLITAAVNVTKAISNFLGTALQTVSQGAAASFQTLFGVSSVGTRVLGSASGGSSAG
ncbi:mucin-17-like isoform X3 [Diabrotica virgifera virgifera]|uniref:Mucin-2-like n=1 Tax=Diabrotica virgifera virgifera TaxID=50390 RepID=A0ABM5JUM8_DIAVI|nr:mucin-17-like isoform X3 [Diabrotica virgifera virgifera]